MVQICIPSSVVHAAEMVVLVILVCSVQDPWKKKGWVVVVMVYGGDLYVDSSVGNEVQIRVSRKSRW